MKNKKRTTKLSNDHVYAAITEYLQKYYKAQDIEVTELWFEKKYVVVKYEEIKETKK